MAVVAGAFAFLLGAGFLAALFSIGDLSPRRRLFEINVYLGSAAVYLALGGFLVVQAASALGGAASSPFRMRWPWLLLPLFPLAVVAGQLQVNDPERLPWLFPFINLAVVAIPSLSVAAICATRYARANPLAWPVSWREWTSGFVYGAIGATTIAGIINTLALFLFAVILTNANGVGTFAVERLPHPWGVVFDLGVLSGIAPIDEEFWKGMLVALFFFRRGGVARCFLWGVLAGAGFNLLETFQNSLGAASPSNLADQRLGGSWWLFAGARAGTGSMHALAAGFSALGFYGLLRRQPRFAWGYPAGVLLHGTWNFLVYVVYGDALFSGAWPDRTALDVVGVTGLILVLAGTLVVLWTVSGSLKDEGPAPIYRLLGMRPAASEAPPGAMLTEPGG